MAARTLITAPAAEPVTIIEAKNHLRVDMADDDALIQRCIVSARRWAEMYTRRAFVTQTWEAHYDRWPRAFEVPLPPLQSVVQITWRTSDNALVVVPPATYVVDTVAIPGRVLLAPGQSWPGDSLWPVNPITLRFTAGYGAASAVPDDIKSAILLLTGHLYEHREQVTPAQTPAALKVLPFAAENLLMPYIAGWF